MKRLFSLLAIATILFLFAPISEVQAQSASDQTWSSTITYFNVSDTDGTITVIFYDGSTSYTSDPIFISAKGSGDVNIGLTSLGSDFSGSAVLSSSVPIVSLSSQYSDSNPSGYSKGFYTGFNVTDAGEKFYLATVRANGITESTIGVQNVESFDINVTLEFYDRFTMGLSFSHQVTLGPNEAYVSKVPDVPNYPGGYWDGSLVITAVDASNPSSPGRVVATALETQDYGYGVYSYEGAKEGSSNYYLPSAMCNYIGQTSYYAIQNIGSSVANVVVDYYDMNGIKVGSMPVIAVQPGAKLSTNPCNDRLLVGQKGSAVVRSTNGVDLIAMGKINTNDGLITAFSGISSGSTNLAAPYIRWSPNPGSNYNTFIAVMNMGTVPAENIVVYYYNADGSLAATHILASSGNPLAPFTKANTTPSAANALTDGAFGYSGNGGAVEIVSDQPVVALVRAAIYPTNIGGINLFGEDYNAISITTP
jgi:hypothetical protein